MRLANPACGDSLMQCVHAPEVVPPKAKCKAMAVWVVALARLMLIPPQRA